MLSMKYYLPLSGDNMKIKSLDLDTAEVIVENSNGKFRTSLPHLLEKLIDQIRINTNGMEKLPDED